MPDIHNIGEHIIDSRMPDGAQKASEKVANEIWEFIYQRDIAHQSDSARDKSRTATDSTVAYKLEQLDAQLHSAGGPLAGQPELHISGYDDKGHLLLTQQRQDAQFPHEQYLVNGKGDVVARQKIDETSGQTASKWEFANGFHKLQIAEAVGSNVVEIVSLDDGRGHTTFSDGAGGTVEQHFGSRPDDAFWIRRSADGQIQVTEKPDDKPYELIDDPKVTSQRDKLLELVRRKIQEPEELSKFQVDMSRLEARSSKQIEELYRRHGVTPEAAKKKANEEVAKTYHEIARLLQAPDNPSLPVTVCQRTQIAEQIMAHAASPNLVDQGHRGTCNVAAAKARIFARQPSEAARLIVDVSTTGEYVTTKDHWRIKIDANSLKPDEETKTYPPPDGSRSLADQYFHVTANNIWFTKANHQSAARYVQERKAHPDAPKPPELHYVNRQIKPGMKAPEKSGEYLVDYTNGRHSTYHGLSGDRIVVAANQVTGETRADWYIEWRNPSGASADSQLILQHKLEVAKREGLFPIEIWVDAGNQPLFSDGGAGSAGGSGGDKGGGHVILVTDYRPGRNGEQPTVSIKNTWGSDSHHSSEPLHTLFLMMHVPIDAAHLTELKGDVENNRRRGHVDDFKEFELLDLQYRIEQITFLQFETQLKKRILEAKKHHDSGSLTETKYASLVNNINTYIDRMPWEEQLKMFQFQRDHGTFASSAQEDAWLRDTMVRVFHERQEAREAGHYVDSRRQQYERCVAMFKQLLIKLPKARRTQIEQDVREAVAE